MYLAKLYESVMVLHSTESKVELIKIKICSELIKQYEYSAYKTNEQVNFIILPFIERSFFSCSILALCY